MQDPIYRLDVAHNSMGYSQMPTTSYCLDKTGVVVSIYPEQEDNFYNFMILIIVLVSITISITTVVIIAFWLSKSKQSPVRMPIFYKRKK